MEKEIIEKEKEYWKGMEDHNYETVKNLTHFPCIIASKNGVQSVDHDKFKSMFESGDGDKVKVLNIGNIEVQLITEKIAIIAYLIELGIKDDKQKSPSKCACTSTWIKQNNNWVCAMHTETELISKN